MSTMNACQEDIMMSTPACRCNQ